MSLNPRSRIQFRFFSLEAGAEAEPDRPESVAAPTADEVHFWRAEVPKELGDREAELLAAFSGEERARAERFRVAAPRIEYIVTRYILRRLLSRYLRCQPSDLEIAYQAKGKPHLPTHPELEFSVSHSHGISVFGFSRQRRVGVDVEKFDRDRPGMDIAERFFSEAECHALRALPEPERGPAFFRIWTRKESYIKGLGSGLAHPLRQFDVSLQAGDQDALLATRPDATEAAHWLVRDVPISEGYAAALAVETG